MTPPAMPSAAAAEREARAILHQVEQEDYRPFTAAESGRFGYLKARIQLHQAEQQQARFDAIRGTWRRAAITPQAFQVAQRLTRPEVLGALSFHESGHAVVGIVFGASPEAVGLEERGGRVVNGFCSTRGPTNAEYALAGGIAARIAGYGSYVVGAIASEGDRRLAHAAGRMNSRGLQQTEQRAEKVLRTNWLAVRALARALMASGYVEGEELGACLEPVTIGQRQAA